MTELYTLLITAALIMVALSIFCAVIAYRLGYSKGLTVGEYEFAKTLIELKKTKENKSKTAKSVATTPDKLNENIIKNAIIKGGSVGKPTLEYAGFMGSIEHNQRTNTYIGHVQNVNGNPAYFGATVESLAKSFQNIVDKNSHKWTKTENP